MEEEGQLVRRLLKSRCGLTIDDANVITFPENGVAYRGDASLYARDGMAKLSQNGVTTILWPAGYEIGFSSAAGKQGYLPEWIVGNDPMQAGNRGGSEQQQLVWSHAWTMTTTTYVPKARGDRICYAEYRTVDRVSSDEQVQQWMCLLYNDYRQLFTGIQVAGPRLTPETMDAGFHAIPRVPSKNNQTPACFYELDDYTCVKDATFEWWDPTQSDPTQSDPTGSDGGGAGTGCWKAIDGGRRYLKGAFPAGNLADQRTGSDACNYWGGLVLVEYRGTQ